MDLKNRSNRTNRKEKVIEEKNNVCHNCCGDKFKLINDGHRILTKVSCPTCDGTGVWEPVYKECVRCGYCCSKAPCSYGKLLPDGKCLFLVVEDAELGTFSCSAKSAIEKREGGSSYSMFGSGCSSTLFNTVRDEVIRKKRHATKE